MEQICEKLKEGYRFATDEDLDCLDNGDATALYCARGDGFHWTACFTSMRKYNGSVSVPIDFSTSTTFKQWKELCKPAVKLTAIITQKR